MLNQQTLTRLRALKLFGLADALTQQLEQPPTQALAFEERLALLVEREVTYRENRRLQSLLRAAKLRQSACVEDIDYRHQRSLDRALVTTLSNGDWLRAHHNLHITGPTGTGKSWLACAFGNQACRQGLSVRYERTGRLLDQLRVARGDGGYPKLLRQLARVELLILDDFGLKPLTQTERHDLLEVIEDRHGLRSTLLTSQLPIRTWHEYLNEPTVADALLDRLLNGAHRLELTGDSLRKKAALTKVKAKQ